MIAVVSTSYQEVDIIDTWIRHLLAEDIDLILIADKLSSDGTRDILDYWHHETGRVNWVDDDQPYHRQSWWTERLASEAHDLGATWILPADVDEFPYAVSGESVALTLKKCQHNKLFMRVWPHKDQDHRFTEPHRLPKVCYQWSPEAHVVMGSHDVSLPGGAYDILAMRELQYRSFEQYCQKVANRNATLEPSARAIGDGWHHLRLEHLDTEGLRQEWELLQSQPSIHDPIPSRSVL